MTTATRFSFLGLIVLVAIVSVMLPRSVDAAISCTQVFTALSPCLGYLTSGGNCPQACCNGVGNLNTAAKSTLDRQVVCGCLKRASSQVNGAGISRAADIPNQCKLHLPYKISPDTDCASIK
ncbi:Lipid transfer protein [Zostera marina]|uniref:Non-specific lipid-transfer protein n=1 Tax=Zostera marina TaxID=29655 RepID=A0A0K9NZL6_ZOSMR|nr:Lipid transfer protein [Zostera marina]